MTTLNFPSTREIRLQKAPLEEVVCQVKFAPILRISNEPPSDFQEAVRQRFPSLVVEQGVLVQFPGAAGAEKPSMESAPRIYRFRTPDELSHAALAMDFFALSTKQYLHWKNFVQDVELGYEAVQKVYQLPYATRIGLRFINRFDQKNTGCISTEQILDLFRPELTCLIRADAWKEPQGFFSQIILNDDKAKLAVRIGFGRENDEPFFVLDLDYFEEGQVSLDNLTKRLNHYHTRIYDAFRWCMLEKSLEQFEPLPEET
jgi:uncharacterized protein (TIGR04255 family)